jgi:hypothetical protein
VQLLVVNHLPHFLLTPGHRLSYRPKPVLPTPLPVAFALGPASMPYTTLPHCPTDASPLSLTPPSSYHPHPLLNHHMRCAHQLLHSLQSLPSSQHPQRLSSLGYPSISLLLVKLVKHFCWRLPSYLQWPCHAYLALGGNKGTKYYVSQEMV